MLISTASAGAAQRFVALGGSGTTCTQAAPCTLPTGINSASAGDEVIVAPGTYAPAVALTNNVAGLNIHGESAASKPVINSSAAMTALSVSGNDLTVSDLVINSGPSQSGLFVSGSNETVQRVEVHSNGSSACAVLSSGVVRDSLCVDTQSGGFGYLLALGGNASMKLRNVTAISSGSATSVAVQVTESTLTASLDAKNVLAFSKGTDVAVKASSASGTATATLQNSNFATVSAAGPGTASVTPVGSATNQSGMPLFTDTTTFRQAPGSPTIDAGAADSANGATDIDGQPRVQGPAIDIGADEEADLTPPEGTIDSHPKPKTKAKTAEFTFSSTEAGSTFTCQIDDKAAAPCTSPLTIKHVKKGRHRFTLIATDAAGNADATPETFKWKVSKRNNKRHHGSHGHHGHH